MERRKFIASSGAALTLALAGCSAGDQTPTSNQTSTPSSEGNEETSNGTPTEGATDGEEGQTETERQTETEEGTDGSNESDETSLRGEPSTLNRLSETWAIFIDDQVVLSGDSNSTETFTLGSGFNAIRYKFVGFELFAPLTDSSGNQVRLINELRGGSGVDGVPIEAGEYTFEVESSDRWELEIGSPNTPSDRIHLPPASVTGSGNDVVGPIEISGGETLDVTYRGEGDLILTSVLADGTDSSHSEELVYEYSGPYDGETTIRDSGVRWLTIYASGEWELEIK